MALHIGDIFSSVEVAKDAINRFILDSGESYMKETSNKRQYSVTCRTQSSGCKFSIRCGLQKDGNARVSKMSPHTCNPRTHYKFKQLSSLWYLLPHHRASISHNREISVAQIRANEKEQWANDINYMAAYRTREALRIELDGREEDDFARMNDLGARIQDVDPQSFLVLESTNDARFSRFFFTPNALRLAVPHLRPFIALDACHCSSRYRQTLMIAVGIDGNNQVVPLCWAICQKEDYNNWRWFLRCLGSAHGGMRGPFATRKDLVIMSDREKGLDIAVQEMLPTATHSYCAQHIAANIQTK
jgi:hypothetical protein